MANFAVLAGSNVTNIIVADTKADAELVTRSTCVEYTDDNPAGIGFTYDDSTGKFLAPVVEEQNA